MRFGIPILRDRVAPRSTIAESILLVDVTRSRILSSRTVPFEGNTWTDLLQIVAEFHVDIVVCGGIERRSKDSLRARKVVVIDNVAGTKEEIIQAMKSDTLESGFGFHTDPETGAASAGRAAAAPNSTGEPRSGGTRNPPWEEDCLTCPDRICLTGEGCSLSAGFQMTNSDRESRRMLEAATDITFEKERILCRISELVYFCLEMKYEQIGIAFCLDLLEPAEILARVLGRFFRVFTVGCKVGGISSTDYLSGMQMGDEAEPSGSIACNPEGQAYILNEAGTDLNVIVGLCMGVDCVFTRASRAPVTTLFVKDKSLANNPIGALYSDYYLREIASTSVNQM